jgi:O-antigen/teichoic acid export membrane protein
LTFFGWQALISVATSLGGAALARRVSPSDVERVRPQWRHITDAKTLALGSGFLSLLFVAANSTDKVLLPRFLTGAEYGLYVATAQLAVIVFLAAHAVWSAIHPRLLMALAERDATRAKEIYSLGAILMTSVCSGAILVTWLAAPSIIALWLPSDSDVPVFANVLVVLTIGYAAAALSHLSLSLQYASKSMTLSIVTLAPALLLVPMGGLLLFGGFMPLSGAVTWTLIYVAFLAGGYIVHLTHGRAFTLLWLKMAIAPLFLSVMIGYVLSPWSYRLTGPYQIVAALLVALTVAGVMICTSAYVRSILKTRLAVFVNFGR